MKISTMQIEVVVAHHFDIRRHLIVPNISWGLDLHECDLLILSQADFATEVEIKVDKYDLIRDKLKSHGHRSNKIKYLYFAIPYYLEKDIEHIPERAGILIINEEHDVKVLRKPIKNKKCRKFTSRERLKMAELGCLRTWALRQGIIHLKQK